MSLGLDAIFQIHEPTCTRYQLSSVVNARVISLEEVNDHSEHPFKYRGVYKTAGLNEAHFFHQHLPSSPSSAPL
jgi:hypothetical protein